MGLPLERVWEICKILDEVDGPVGDYELERAIFLTDKRPRPTVTPPRWAEA